MEFRANQHATPTFISSSGREFIFAVWCQFLTYNFRIFHRDSPVYDSHKVPLTAKTSRCRCYPWIMKDISDYSDSISQYWIESLGALFDWAILDKSMVWRAPNTEWQWLCNYDLSVLSTFHRFISLWAPSILNYSKILNISHIRLTG